MRLLFVYNANSGIVNNWIDIAHKVVHPSSYECDLCSLTHGSFREKRLWKTFRDRSKLNMEFYHKDEFLKKFASKWLPKYSFPIILLEKEGYLEPFITPPMFKKIHSVEELISKIEFFSTQNIN